MFCKYCGAQIDDESIFCSRCGKSLGNAAPAAAAPAAVAQPVEMRKIRVSRPGKLTAAMQYIQVYIDDVYVGLLRNGESLEAEVEAGQRHRMYATSNTTNGVGTTQKGFIKTYGVAQSVTSQSDVVTIDAGTSTLSYTVAFKMGMMAARIVFEKA